MTGARHESCHGPSQPQGRETVTVGVLLRRLQNNSPSTGIRSSSTERMTKECSRSRTLVPGSCCCPGVISSTLPEQQKTPGAKGSVTLMPGVQGEPLLRQHDLFWHWSEKQQSSEVWQLPSLGGTQGRQPLAGPTPTQCLSQPAAVSARGTAQLIAPGVQPGRGALNSVRTGGSTGWRKCRTVNAAGAEAERAGEEVAMLRW